jgi:hypothetical protein
MLKGRAPRRYFRFYLPCASLYDDVLCRKKAKPYILCRLFTVLLPEGNGGRPEALGIGAELKG